MTTETQTQSAAQDSGTKKNRKLKIKCAPTLEWISSTKPYDIGATMAFDEDDKDTEPSMPGVVSTDGDIDISDLPANDDYNDNIDITFKLETGGILGPDGKKIKGKVRWAYATEGAYTYEGESGDTGYGWFCKLNDNPPPAYDKLPPQTIEGMSFVRNGDGSIEIKDDTPDGTPGFGYCVGFVLEDYDNYYISIDPRVSSKGVLNANFMLKS
uniref:hypothetical protein n=1 Tax=uncultured Altererythrobacter sp. TaxID=500840 RepID=UPI00262EB528|nr:hypothetical protein [uncultured Altererythrobacter sp.]